MSTASHSYTVAVEGNIGVGKSTLTRSIAKASGARYGAKSVDIVLEETAPAPFLQLFYADPAQYAFAFQLYMMSMRKLQGLATECFRFKDPAWRDTDVVLDALRRSGGLTSSTGIPSSNDPVPNAGAPCLDAAESALSYLTWWDRSVLGDFVFCLANFVSGRISRDEFSTYIKLATCDNSLDVTSPIASVVKRLLEKYAIDAIVYLHDSPARCHLRVVNVRGNAAEKDIPLSYFELLDALHWHVIVDIVARELSTPVMLLGWDDYSENVDRVRDMVARVCSGSSGNAEQSVPHVLRVGSIPYADKAGREGPSLTAYIPTDSVLNKHAAEPSAADAYVFQRRVGAADQSCVSKVTVQAICAYAPTFVLRSDTYKAFVVRNAARGAAFYVEEFPK